MPLTTEPRFARAYFILCTQSIIISGADLFVYAETEFGCTEAGFFVVFFCHFVNFLLNKALSNSDYTVSNATANDELERI